MAISRPALSETGLILINKPRGITSFGVVSRLRKLTGVRRIGHTGTLDPFADGLLPVCIGRATAVVQFMDGYDKTYRLGIEFGRATDTQDLTGQTLFEHQLSDAEKAELRHTGYAALYEAVAGLAGEHLQMPPMFSAVKIDGRPLYEYARQGREIERRSRPVRIYSARVNHIEMDGTLRASLDISCSKGTYMRTLADDLGRQLGYGAHAASLTRLQCGPFALEQAVDLDQLFTMRETCADQPAFLQLLHDQGLLLEPASAFMNFTAIELTEPDAIRLINGQPLAVSRAAVAGWLPGARAGDAQALPELPVEVPLVVFCRNRLVAVIRLQAGETGSPDMLKINTERVLIDLADFRQS